VLPLFARQTAVEQGRVFAPHQGRRVVLATNVAETSLTVPGIRYVIDSGLARVKRYSHRNKVEQLQVEPISRAAASQRAGRCGRVSAGVCFKLYDEEDFNKRPPYTEPEILRSSLAGVILRMKSLHLGDVEDFPFLEAPAPRMIADGYQLLAELGALDEASKELTKVGRELAKLPLDPKIGRMILAAREGCLREVLIIAAALSAPRIRATGRRSRPVPPTRPMPSGRTRSPSSFPTWNLWKAGRRGVEARDLATSSASGAATTSSTGCACASGATCMASCMTLCHEHGWKENQIPASYEAIHKALLTGLLGHVGLIERRPRKTRTTSARAASASTSTPARRW
jgi:ATP-dependent helicase HrpA